MNYLEDGDFVEVLASFKGGFVVRRLFENVDDEFGDSDPFIVNRVFDKPPTFKKDERIAKLEKEIAILKLQRDRFLDCVTTAKTEMAKSRQDLEEFRSLSETDAAMKRVYNLITSKITHIVYDNYYECEVKKIEDCTSSTWKEHIRLVTLFGDTKGKLSWGINQYSNGNGDTSRCYPCLSLAEATETAKPFVMSHLNNARGRESLERAIASAKLLGIEIEPKYQLQVDKEKADDIATKKKQLEEQLSKLTA